MFVYEITMRNSSGVERVFNSLLVAENKRLNGWTLVRMIGRKIRTQK